MKIIIGLILVFVCSLSAVSQNINKFEFIGTITITDGEVLSYKVVFSQTKGNAIKGYTITDLYGENLTKTSIVGQYDTINNILSFNELGNVYSKLNEADSTFCFVSAKKLKIKNINGYKLITGNFKGLFLSGEICADGKIFLAESNVVKKIKAVADSIINSQDSSNTAQDSIKVLNKQQEMVLMSNDKLLVDYVGKNLVLEVWDGATADNDRISIYINGIIFKENITLTSNKKIIKLPSSEDIIKLKIVALNLGYSGINTVNFAVKYNFEVKEFTSRLYEGESFDVEFNRK